MTVLRDLVELRRILRLADDVGCDDTTYPLRVPRSFVDRMEKGNPNDPLLLQVLPRAEESVSVPGFSLDPLGECPAGAASLQKYAGRRLLLVTPQCGVHCRFCFRRHTLPTVTAPDFEVLLDPVRRDPSVVEVVLSGGDPLMLVDEELKRLFHYIVKIPHVKRIRLHSRLPIVMPGRVTARLVDAITVDRPVYPVVHVNHPNELADDVVDALRRLRGMPVMSQTVLLKGINDDVETLFRLFDRLADVGVLPYYLHQLDRVRGAAHFEVDEAVGRDLVARLRDRLPGYAVPRYVREVAGGKSKRSC